MKTIIGFKKTCLLLLSAFYALGAFAASPTDDALSPDPAIATRAIAALRARGPAGLEALLDAQAEAIAKMRAGAAADDRFARLRTAIDEVAQQRDAYASRLYWFTDLEKAKAEAQATGRPILSLRLLGKLNEEFSCANSRLFRTVLYANAAVSERLRHDFVLHWESVRPVPRITIDFGDGRKLERTVTGNSVHCVLDRDGRVVDALPGLYNATVFLDQLAAAEKIARDCSGKDDRERAALLAVFHQGSLDHPIAITASAGIDDSARALLRTKFPTATQAAAITTSKTAVEDPLVRTIRNLNRSVAEDTARNESELHMTIHKWFARGERTLDLRRFSDKIYSDLFLTPNTDPWLGLAPADAYSAINNEGKIGIAQQAPGK